MRKQISESVAQLGISITAITAIVAFSFGHLEGGYAIAVSVGIFVFWIGIFIDVIGGD